MIESSDRRQLSDLAIFPLPDAVLLPGALLPLHVFEQRYRDMVRDVLADDRLLGIARLRPGYEADYYGRPPVYDTCGVGVIVADEALDDGRYNILVRGLGRARIEEELAVATSYRRVRARVLPDGRSRRPEVVSATFDQLIALCGRLADAIGDDAEPLCDLMSHAASPAACADLLGAALMRDPDERQRLLETLDPADRLEAVLARVSHLLAKVGPSNTMLN